MFSCPENWKNMQAVPGGRWCGVCEKTVMDITQLSEQEFEALRARHGGSLCVRGRYDQWEPQINTFRKMVGIAGLVAVGFGSLVNTASGQKYHYPNGKISITQKEPKTDHFINIEGKVSFRKGATVKSVSINIYNQEGLRIAAAETDDDGQFTIAIHKAILGETARVEVKSSHLIIEEEINTTHDTFLKVRFNKAKPPMIMGYF